MKKTMFDKKLWKLSSFNEIGFDKQAEKLYVFYYNGDILEFQRVKEQDVFDLIITTNKEHLVNHYFKKQFPSIIHRNRISI